MSYTDYDSALNDNSVLIETMINDIIANEGGYVNHDADRGHQTNFGITLATWNDYLGDRKSNKRLPSEIRDITRSQAREYYQYRFRRNGLWRLSSELWYLIYDFEVNAGRNAVKELQRFLISNERTLAYTVAVDGVIGDKTAKAVDLIITKLGIRNFIYGYTQSRLAYYVDIARCKPSQQVFLEGWTRRTIRTLQTISSLVESPRS